MTTLPQFTKDIDNAFTETWYEIQAQAADQILDATVVWALLKMKGCFKTQVGGTNIERTLKYNVPTATAVAKGDVLTQGELEVRTAAFWTFRNMAIHVQRDTISDTANRGKFRIIDYVADRLEDATNGLRQKYEDDLLRAIVTAETGKEIQGLLDMLPVVGSRTTGTYGGIARPTTFSSDLPTVGNTWWTPKYKQFTANKDVNLVSDMKTFFNTVSNNQESPDVILTTQTLYEQYEDFGLDAVQFVGNSKLLDLGFTTLKFKGADLVWTSNAPADEMRFLNTKHIEVVYDPGLWFEMTAWKDIPLQMERIAHIICRMNVISKQLRRHGVLYT
jgi:hypothetical protein